MGVRPIEPKVCIRCRTDCSARARVKDQHGRYVCMQCIRNDEASAAAAPVATAVAHGQGHTFADTIPIEEDAPPAIGLPTCPACQSSLPYGATICVQCGFDAATNIRRTTNLGEDTGLPDRPPAAARCPNCNYNLKGLRQPVCPECGMVVLKPDPKARAKAVARQTARWAYIKPLIQFGIGAAIMIIFFLALGEGSLIPRYGLRYAIGLPIGVVAYFLCCALWLGFDAPLHLTALRLAGVYALTDASRLLFTAIPVYFIGWILGAVVYILLLADALELDLEDALIVGAGTFLVQALGVLAIASYIFAQS